MFDRFRFRQMMVLGVAAGLALAACQAGDPARGQAAEVQFSKQCLMVSPNEGCAVGDVDRDGKPDIVAGTHWFKGPDFVPHPVRDVPQVMTEFYANNGDHLYDVNGDGWLDVISGGWMESEIFWYENPRAEGLARGYKWKQHLLKDTRPHNEAYQLHDFDGDGVPELFVDSWEKKWPVVAWKLAKTPEGEPTLEEVVLGADGGGHGYAFGDLNGDGREDLLVETGWYERPEGNPLAKPWKFHPETALPHPSCPFLVVDLTGDGRADLVWGKAHDYGLYWWEQGEPKPDGTTTWTEHPIDKSWSQVHCIVWADLDGDGAGEVITGKRVRGHAGKDPGGMEPECLYYYTWDPSAREFTRHTISPPGGGVGTGMQIRTADLNGDGRLDIAVSGKTGTWALLNEGSK
jgi:hypothetical protein